jgi:hypothetical protein
MDFTGLMNCNFLFSIPNIDRLKPNTMRFRKQLVNTYILVRNERYDNG